MLLQGIIPSTEPSIRVGIVLPEDCRRSIKIELPGEDLYSIQPGQEIGEDNCLQIDLSDDELVCGNLSVLKFNITRLNSTSNYARVMTVHDVVAGRAFHWKKNIAVNLLGDLEIRVQDGYITVVNELPLEHYLMCVATSEMSAECPSSLIEAQTIVARAWMLANVEQKHRHLGFDVCNDDCCQRYHGTGNLTPHAVAGAQATRGQVIMYDDKICDARYSKSCGGMMETFETLWDGDPLPYMQNAFDSGSTFEWSDLPLSDEENLRKWINATPHSFCSPEMVLEETLTSYIGGVDEEGKYFRWQFEYDQQEITDLLNKKLDLAAVSIVNITALSRGGSGRMNKARIDYISETGKTESITVSSEYEIRRIFHPSFLYSSAFVVQLLDLTGKIPGRFILRGAGWGHGAGLCQIGALGMALKGYRAETILKHYYPESRLVKIYS